VPHLFPVWHTLADAPGEAAGNVPPLYEALIKKIFDAAKDHEPVEWDKATAIDTASTFMAGVIEGYGKDFVQIAYDSPDYDMLTALSRNVYQFSSAKNYHMLQEMTLALKDGDRIRSFTEYRREALKIVDEWNNNWGQTEYNTGVASAQMAGKWVGFKKNEAAMPNLQYTTVGDMRVRDEHRILDGIIRSVEDPFWNTYYPPNGFNCRCSAIQLAGDQSVTPDKELVYPDIPKMFRVNLAKERLVFPEGSAYFKDLPKDIRHKDITIQRAVVRDWAKANLAGKSYPSAIGDIHLSKGNIHDAIGKAHDHEFEKNTAMYNLPQLIKDGKLVASDVDDAKGRPNIKWSYLQVRVAGEKSYLNIYKDTDSGKQYFHAITDKLEKKKPE